MKSTSTTTYSFSPSMTLEDIESWRDLLEQPKRLKPNAMLTPQTIVDGLSEQTRETKQPIFGGIDVFAIPDEAVDWVPRLGKGRVILCQLEQAVRIVQWLGSLRQMPESIRNYFIERAKIKYEEAKNGS